LQAFLSERTHADGGPMTRLDSTADGKVVIELLKVVLSRSRDREPDRGAVGDAAPAAETSAPVSIGP
jgi:hypothetical protein